MNFIETLLIAAIPSLVTGIIVYLTNNHQIAKYKADSMAERSARHFLEHKSYTDRSFKTLQKYLGGWDNDPDELRRILVRAGAVRVFREDKDKQEWWYLLSRGDERIKNKKSKA